MIQICVGCGNETSCPKCKPICNEWIKCSEQLPVEHEVYLTYAKDGCIEMLYYFPFNNTFANDNVTHWMPLPEPPND